VIIDAFPLNTLLPTSRFIFEELHHLREVSAKDPDNDIVRRRFAGVRRILKWVSRRLVNEGVSGAQSFLEQLHRNGILAFHELPADVQYVVNTQKMTRDVLAHLRSYIERMLRPPSAEEAEVLLKCFRRVIPSLMAEGNWRVIRLLARAVHKAASTGAIARDAPELSDNPVLFLLADRLEELAKAFERADRIQRREMEDVLALMGPIGVEVLCRILTASQSRPERKAAIKALSRKGEQAREWALAVLDASTETWFVKRNALLLLSRLARGDEDADRVRTHTHHPHARVRDEALKTLFALKVPDAEQFALRALDDPDEKVRWLAINGLSELAPLSRPSMDRRLGFLGAEPPAEKEQEAAHRRKTIQLLRSLGRMKAFEDPVAVEGAVLEVARKASRRKRSLLRPIGTSRQLEDVDLFSAAVATLGTIGGSRSQEFIAKQVQKKGVAAEAAGKALNALLGRRQDGQGQPV
jgi:hypothetical protein